MLCPEDCRSAQPDLEHLEHQPWMAGLSDGWLVGWLCGPLVFDFGGLARDAGAVVLFAWVGCLRSLLPSWLVGWLVGWLLGWLAGWLPKLVGWLVGRLPH